LKENCIFQKVREGREQIEGEGGREGDFSAPSHQKGEGGLGRRERDLSAPLTHSNL